jgi:BolA family transcriptional regulator, general stress-responsive regulator
MEEILRAKLVAGLSPVFLELTNESPMHGLPLSAEKHFRVVAVSAKFAGLSRVDRHRLVNELVADELKTHVHAFSIQGYTPEEWAARGGETFESPECLGGGKKHGMHPLPPSKK